jgi:transposase
MKGSAMKNVNKLSFSGNHFYIGIDVHKKSWTVTIRCEKTVVSTFSMNPSPEELRKHLEKNYPGGKYFSVYEAGYCRFWIHRQFCSLGIENIVINPADVPTTDKERRHKTDLWDSRKLSRELCNNSLKAIYVPDEFHESLRSLCRLRERTVSHQTRLKNRIKAYLSLQGVTLPRNSECQHWSRRFMNMLKELEFTHEPGANTFEFSIAELEATRKRVLEITRQLRHYSQKSPNFIIEYLLSVTGVGFTTAITFYTEIMDITRFSNCDRLNTFIGFAPSTHSSGERDKSTGITKRKNRFLRYLLIEAAWIAIRKDPALLMHYTELVKRMPAQQAIIRIAKKLVRRMRYVWINQQTYEICVVE